MWVLTSHSLISATQTFNLGPSELEAHLVDVPVEVGFAGDFYLMDREVSNALYQDVTGDSPSTFGPLCDVECPVETVTWHQAAAFANLLSEAVMADRCYECTGQKQNPSATVHSSQVHAMAIACPLRRSGVCRNRRQMYRYGSSEEQYGLDPSSAIV